MITTMSGFESLVQVRYGVII